MPNGRGTAMRLAWMTDVHLNFLEPARRHEFLESVQAQADAFVISGDIAESPSIYGILGEINHVLCKPVYFVLGNHDFYRGSIGTIRGEVTDVAERLEWLTYLTAAGVIELTPQTALVGHDGWADARLGDFDTSDVILNDYVTIRELFRWRSEFDLDKPALRKVLNELGDEAARHFERVLQQAVAKYPRIIAVTHVPPFKEAAWHEGRQSDDNYLPHFTCKAVGDAMRKVMTANPQSRLLVLCGHTHGAGEVRILDNLLVMTGGARYGDPAIQHILTIE